MLAVATFLAIDGMAQTDDSRPEEQSGGWAEQ